MQMIIIDLLVKLGFSEFIAKNLLVIVASLLLFIVSFLIIRVIRIVGMSLNRTIIKRFSKNWFAYVAEHKIIHKISYFTYPIVFSLGKPLLVFSKISWSLTYVHAISVLISLSILYGSIRLIFGLLDALRHWYDWRFKTLHQPIKGYIQIAKIFIVCIGFILALSIVLDRSPTALLTGLGAMSAVLLLVFKDTITGFAASIQVASLDMVRVGDWVTIPSYHADGDVIDISVNTVKIQNFDKTIVTMPTRELVNTSVQNWRGMQNSGGRRIKRAIQIDINSIDFCNEALLQRLKKLQVLAPIVTERCQEIEQFNTQENADTSCEANGRRLTNIGLFRYYIEGYLRSLSTINFNMTFLVRQLAPSELGLPLEIYVFTNDTNWNRYEAIQADIFDHLFAAMKLFDLRPFQLSIIKNHAKA